MVHAAPYLISVATLVSVYAIAALGLNLQFGVAGLFNVGGTAFIAVGAYTSAIVTGPAYPHGLGGFGLPLAAGLAAAACAGGLTAAAVGVGLLRFRADALAIATFGLAAAVQLAITNLPSLTGGFSGLSGVPLRAGDSGLNLGWLALCAGLAAATWFGLRRLDAGPWGRSLRAVSDDPDAAAATGKNVALYRMQAFAAGAALMGLSGALLAHNSGFISPQDFMPVLNFQLYAMVIIGGAGRYHGCAAGGCRGVDRMERQRATARRLAAAPGPGDLRRRPAYPDRPRPDRHPAAPPGRPAAGARRQALNPLRTAPCRRPAANRHTRARPPGSPPACR